MFDFLENILTTNKRSNIMFLRNASSFREGILNMRYVLKNKARFYIFILALLMTVFTVFSVTRAYGYKETQLKVIRIKSGDTLWAIAEKYNKKGDIREYIYELKKINSLTDSSIMAGSDLKVIIE